MDDPQCKDCQYFRQHYVYFCGIRYVTVPCGHCIFPRLKHRKPDTFACVYFVPRLSPEEPADEA